MSSRDHQSRRDSERQAYDELRQAGIRKEHARKIAEESSTLAHRQIDSTNSSTARKPR